MKGFKFSVIVAVIIMVVSMIFICNIVDGMSDDINELTLELDILDKQLLESQEHNAKLDMEINLLIKSNALLLDKLEEKELLLERNKTQSKVSRGNSKAPLEFIATAYCPCEICCGKWSGGNTKSGTKPKAGRTIAVDPKVIPLGSTVLVNGKKYIAEDTGSAINGKVIDIFFNTHEEALKWGRQKVQVEVIKN